MITDGHFAHLCSVAIMLTGLWGMMLKRNLVKKLIGLNVFQAGIILFFIVHAYKFGATPPIWDPSLSTDPVDYINPIPHGLMLTAIVVSVATTGVGLALLIRIQRTFDTLEEHALLEKLRRPS